MDDFMEELNDVLMELYKKLKKQEEEIKNLKVEKHTHIYYIINNK